VSDSERVVAGGHSRVKMAHWRVRCRCHTWLLRHQGHRPSKIWCPLHESECASRFRTASGLARRVGQCYADITIMLRVTHILCGLLIPLDCADHVRRAQCVGNVGASPPADLIGMESVCVLHDALWCQNPALEAVEVASVGPLETCDHGRRSKRRNLRSLQPLPNITIATDIVT
jgi:hypothetical protein